MSDFIESFYYGNIEPQSLTTELTPKLRKKLSEIVKKEEELTAKLPEGEERFSQSTQMLILSFQAFAFATALSQASGSVQSLLMMLLLIERMINYELWLCKVQYQRKPTRY